MKALKLVLLLICSILLCGCSGGEKVASLADDPKRFYEAWDEAVLADIDTVKIINKLAIAFPEELNIETNRGLILPDSFTGPVLCYEGNTSYKFNGIYTPDQNVQDYIDSPQHPNDPKLKKYASSASRIPNEYLSDEKLAELRKNNLPIVFAMVECIGYTNSNTYYVIGNPNGSDVYWLGWRVSFYSYPDCKLLGWEAAERPYGIPDSMAFNQTFPDGNGKRVYLNDNTGATVDVLNTTMKLLYGDSFVESHV